MTTTFDGHANLAYGVVVGAPGVSGTELEVTPGQQEAFATPPFNMVCWPPLVQPTVSNAEIVRVTGVNGIVFTIVRQQEGSSAQTILAGWQMAAGPTVKAITDLESAVNAAAVVAAAAAPMTALMAGLPEATTLTTTGTLSANKLTPCDATSAGFSAAMPSTGSLAYGALVAVEKIDATANLVSITGTFRGVAGTITLALAHETVVFFYEGSGSFRPLTSHKTLSSLDARYTISGASGPGQLPVSAVNGVRPEAYGAVGNGSTDDTAALTAAINAVSGTGKAILLTQNYLVSSINQTVNNLTIQALGGAQIISSLPKLTTSPVLWLQGSGIHLKDLTITYATPWNIDTDGGDAYTNGSNASTIRLGIAGRSAVVSDVSVERCKISHSRNTSIFVDYAQRVRIVDNTCLEQGQGICVADIIDDCIIRGNIVQRSVDDLIAVLADSAVTNSTGNRVIISGNSVSQGYAQGIDLTGVDGCIVADNIIDTTYAPGILVYQFSGAGPTGPDYRVQIHGNQVRNAGTYFGAGQFRTTVATSPNGIDIEAQAGVVVAGNYVYDTQGRGIQAAAGASEIDIHDNHVIGALDIGINVGNGGGSGYTAVTDVKVNHNEIRQVVSGILLGGITGLTCVGNRIRSFSGAGGAGHRGIQYGSLARALIAHNHIVNDDHGGANYFELPSGSCYDTHVQIGSLSMPSAVVATLGAAITSTSATSITTTAAAAASLQALGTFQITIDNEDMLVTGGSATTTWTPIVRGINGTVAATHSNAANVYGVPSVDGDSVTRFTIGGVAILVGAGSPNGAVTAPVGSLYLQTDGSGAAVQWAKGSGTGNTGWINGSAFGPSTTLTVAALSAVVGPIASQTTLQNITGLGLTIGSSATEMWRVTWHLLINAADHTMGVKFGFTVPAGCSMQWATEGGLASEIPSWGARSSTNTPNGVAAAGATISAGAPASGTFGQAITAIVFGGGTGGVVQPQYAQVTSDAGNLQVNAGSVMEAVKVAS